jgi:hypothetical protein
VVGPVFDGRVGNGVPAVRVAVSGYYEKLELTLKLTSAARVRRPELPRLISGSQHYCERLFSYFSSRGDPSTGATGAVLFERS